METGFMYLWGRYPSCVDEQHRILLPVRLRNILQAHEGIRPHLYVHTVPEASLIEFYPERAFDIIGNEFHRRFSEDDPKRRSFFGHYAYPKQWDARTGRITLEHDFPPTKGTLLGAGFMFYFVKDDDLNVLIRRGAVIPAATGSLEALLT